MKTNAGGLDNGESGEYYAKWSDYECCKAQMDLLVEWMYTLREKYSRAMVRFWS